MANLKLNSVFSGGNKSGNNGNKVVTPFLGGNKVVTKLNSFNNSLEQLFGGNKVVTKLILIIFIAKEIIVLPLLPLNRWGSHRG